MFVYVLTRLSLPQAKAKAEAEEAARRKEEEARSVCWPGGGLWELIAGATMRVLTRDEWESRPNGRAGH
jgi:hypothetical protein